jgi:hypothetical protein
MEVVAHPDAHILQKQINLLMGGKSKLIYEWGQGWLMYILTGEGGGSFGRRWLIYVQNFLSP